GRPPRCVGRQAVLPPTRQRGTGALLEVELDRGHGVGRFAPPIDEALGWKYLEDDAVPIGVDVFLGSPIAPTERELATGSEVDLTAPRPPPTVQPLRGREGGPHLLARRADEDALADREPWSAHDSSSTSRSRRIRRCS